MKLLGHEKAVLLFLARHLAAGVAAGFLFGVLVVVLDIAHLRTLAGASADGVLTLALLFFGLMVSFGGLAMAVAIMSMGEEDR